MAQGETMKVTYTQGHGNKATGEAYNPNHNTLEKTRRGQPHIDEERLKDNVYMKMDENAKITTYRGGSGGFDSRKHELEMYDKKCGEGIEARNERYEKSGHKDRCRSINQIYSDIKTAPMESIWQIGNSKTEMDAKERTKILKEAFSETYMEIRKFGKDNFVPLDMALHRDETGDHIHFRGMFIAKDKFGFYVPNQTQALQNMGIQRPNPDKPRSRYNNELIGFTDKVREIFYQACEKRGIVINREVENPSRRHLEVLEFKCQEAEKEVQMQRQAAQRAQEALEKTLGNIQTLRDKIRALEASQAALEAKNNSLVEENRELKTENKELRNERNDLSIQVARISSEIGFIKQQKLEAEKQRDTAVKEKEKAVEKLEKIEEYQSGLYRQLASKSYKKYGTVPAQKEKKNIRGQVVQEARPECTIIATEDLKQLEELASYKVSVDYNRDTVSKIDRTIMSNDVIQDLKDKLEDMRIKNNELSLNLEKKTQEVEDRKQFLEERGLEDIYNAPKIEHEHEHYHHRRR